jgi:hypothetical protein
LIFVTIEVGQVDTLHNALFKNKHACTVFFFQASEM